MSEHVSNGISAMLATWKSRALDGAGTPEYQERQRAIHHRDWMDRCEARNVPEHIRRLVAGGVDESGVRFRETEAVRAILRAIRAGKRFVVLSGPTGTGKTVACCYVLTMPYSWARADEIAQEPPTYGGRFGTHVHVSRAIGDFNRPQAILCEGWMPLVLDDVGLEDAKQTRAVDEILQARHRNGCITLMTTNLTAEQMAERYDPRTISRLDETGHVLRVSEVVRPGSRKAA